MNKIKTLMKLMKHQTTIDKLAKAIDCSEADTRNYIAQIRKIRPIYADKNGKGYKYASKAEISKLIEFEKRVIKNHQANLKVLERYR